MKRATTVMMGLLVLALMLGLPVRPTAALAQANMSEATPPPADDKPGAQEQQAGGEALPGVDGGGGTGGANRPVIDPFKALIEPPKQEQPVTPIVPAISAPPPPPPPIPPVNFKVNAVAGDHPNYVAVIEFEGQTYIVQKDTKVPDEQNPAFDVKEVTAEKVVVFDRKINRLVPKQLITE